MGYLVFSKVQDKKIISNYFKNSEKEKISNFSNNPIFPRDNFIPLPFKLWPSEGKLFFLFLGI